MKTRLVKLWCSMQYRYCMSSAYLASQRGDGVAAADFLCRASDWQREYLMAGRSMV
jgi:hypothetical protein